MSSLDRSASVGPAEAALRLSAFLPYRLNVMAAVVSDGLASTYAERFGLSVPEWRLLATLVECGRMTAKAVGAHAHMGKVKVSRAVASLERRGLISREQNRDDLRESFLVLTRAGRRMHGEIAPLALDYVARLTACLTADERAALEAITDKLVQAAAEISATKSEGPRMRISRAAAGTAGP